MNYYIESRDTDPCHNLALEQAVFERLDRAHSYFMLWQNRPSIIVGKHQNTAAEINASFVKKNNVAVVRRLSGGGAVYHDLGNINFTIITDASGGIDFSTFCKPVQQALVSFGVPAVVSGRNDMTVDGKKFSGSAQYIKQNRVMHHGTILYDSDIGCLSQALNVPNDKIESKGIASVKSRVANIRPYMHTALPVGEFWDLLKRYMFAAFDLKPYALPETLMAEVQQLREQVYSQWEWNYGASPPYNARKERRIENCGKIEVLLNITKGGIINDIAFYGDFFGNGDPTELARLLAGHRLERCVIQNVLHDINISHYFHNIDAETFLALLLE